MKINIALSCEDIIRDAETNSISIHNIIEELNAERIPFIIPKFAIFYLIEKEEGDNEEEKAKLVIKNGDKDLQTFPISIGFQDKIRNRNIIKIGGLPISVPGELSVELKKEDDTIISKLIYPVLIRNVPNVQQG